MLEPGGVIKQDLSYSAADSLAQDRLKQPGTCMLNPLVI